MADKVVIYDESTDEITPAENADVLTLLELDTVVTDSHERLHSVTSTDDHTFPGGTSTYLRADGTWQIPPGGGGGVNLDGGYPDSTYGGVSPLDCGGVS